MTNDVGWGGAPPARARSGWRRVLGVLSALVSMLLAAASAVYTVVAVLADILEDESADDSLLLGFAAAGLSITAALVGPGPRPWARVLCAVPGMLVLTVLLFLLVGGDGFGVAPGMP